MELNPSLLRIDSLKKEAESLQPAKPEWERAFWDKFRLEFNYNSNHMEGNTLTYGHTQLLLIFGKVTAEYSFRELEEMKAHDAALKKVKENAMNSEFTFTEKFIKNINELILVEPYYRDAKDSNGNPSKKLIQPGDYKTLPNHVELQTGEIFYFSQPEETRAHMGDLIDWYRKESESKELHPVQIATLFHYRFVRIHPFDDGNGRTARLMMNYILMKNGFAPVVIESIDKKNYLAALNKADTGDLQALVEYITALSLRWQELYTKVLKGEKIEEEKDFEKEVEVLKKNLNQKNKENRKSQLNEILDNSLLPLIREIVEKTSKLDVFFESKEVSFFAIDNHNQNHYFDKLTSSYFLPETVIRQVYYRYVHRELKSVISYTEYATFIRLILGSDHYELIIEPVKRKLKKKSNQILTKEEVSEIADMLSKDELNFIKEHS